MPLTRLSIFFFFNDTATTEIYPLSLHDALPISFRAGDVDRHRLLQIHVLAGGNGGFEVLRMEVGWRRDDNRVHLLGGSESLVGARADEELLRIPRREPLRLLPLIEMRARRVELV